MALSCILAAELPRNGRDGPCPICEEESRHIPTSSLLAPGLVKSGLPLLAIITDSLL